MKLGSLKSRVVSGLLVLSLVLGVAITPKRSEAGLGVLVTTVGGSPVAGLMFFAAAVGAGAGSAYFFKKGGSTYPATESLTNFLAGVGTALFGVVLLDGAAIQSGDFQSLSATGARNLGLTESEWRSYESELPMLNALREEAMARTDADLKGFEVKTSADLEKVANTLRSHWTALSDGILTTETISTIQKMGLAAVARN